MAAPMLGHLQHSSWALACLRLDTLELYILSIMKSRVWAMSEYDPRGDRSVGFCYGSHLDIRDSPGVFIDLGGALFPVLVGSFWCTQGGP